MCVSVYVRKSREAKRMIRSELRAHRAYNRFPMHCTRRAANPPRRRIRIERANYAIQPYGTHLIASLVLLLLLLMVVEVHHTCAHAKTAVWNYTFEQIAGSRFRRRERFDQRSHTHTHTHISYTICARRFCTGVASMPAAYDYAGIEHTKPAQFRNCP